MATRTNLSPNPSCKVNATGWFGGTGAARVTGQTGFDRTTGFAATIDVVTPQAAVTPGVTYTGSIYVKNSSAATLSYGIDWYDSGGYLSSTVGGTGFAVSAGAVNRLVTTGVAPAGAVGGLCAVQTSAGTVTVACELFEQVATVGTYFDGDSAGGAWTGTNGNSPSTLTTGGPVALDGKAVAASAARGSLSTTRPLAGSAPAASVARGALAVDRALSGIAAAASSASGDLTVTPAGWNGAAAAASGASGSLSITRDLTGTAAAASGASGLLGRDRPLDGVAAAASGAAGSLGVARALAGAAAAASTAAGALAVDEAPHPLPAQGDDLPPAWAGWRRDPPRTYRPPTVIYY